MLRWLVALQRALCAAVWVLFALGCGRALPVHPLALSGLASDSLVEGDDLELLGSKLPIGLVAELELRGTLHAPGQAERAVRVNLSGRTLSSELLRAAFPPDLLAEWGRGSFEGGVSVSARDVAGARFSAALPALTFELEAQSARAAQLLRHRAETSLDPLGIEFAAGDATLDGLHVARVQPGGAAWRAGLHEGDAIVVSGGVRVRALGDLAPAPNATMLALHVRDASGAVHPINLPLANAAPLANARGLAWCLLACPALLLLLTLSPLPAPGEWLRRALERVHSRREAWLSAPWVLIAAWASVQFAQHLDPFSVLLVHLGVLVALRAWRADGLLVFAAQLFGLWLASACAAAVSGSDKWLAIVNDQGSGPWAWNVFARPPLAVALWLGLRCAVGLHSARRSELPSRWLDGVGRALVCGLFGALFLGGGGTSSGALLAVLSAACKGWLCLGLWCYVPEAPGAGWRRELGYLGATLLATLAWSWAAPSRAFEQGLGCAVCVFALFVAGVAALQLRAAQGRVQATAEPRAVSPVSST